MTGLNFNSSSTIPTLTSSTTNCLICNDEIAKVIGVKLTPYTFQGLVSVLQLPPLPRGLGRGVMRHGHVLLCAPCANQVSKYKNMLVSFKQLQKDMNEIQESVTKEIIRNSDECVQADVYVKTARDIICSNLREIREELNLGVYCTTPTEPDLNMEEVKSDEDPLSCTSKPQDSVKTRKCSVALEKLVFKRKWNKDPIKNSPVNSEKESDDEYEDLPGPSKRKLTKNLRRFQCSQCGMLLQSKKGLEQHQALHNKTYSCPVCGKPFSNQGRLKMHLNWHAGKERYRCSFPNCPATFLYQSDFARHMRTHTGVKVISCTQCEASFGRNSSLNRHVREVHNNTKRYGCKECGQSFQTRGELVTHEYAKDTEKDVRIECTWCNKLFTRRTCLREHESNIHHILVQSETIEIKLESMI